MEIIRGDYKVFKIQRKSNGAVIEDLPEKMYFTVKENEYAEKVLIQKTLTNGIVKDDEHFYNIEILPEDTDKLSYGNYIYDIEIKNGDKPKTIIVDTFKIKKEVTFASNEV